MRFTDVLFFPIRLAWSPFANLLLGLGDSIWLLGLHNSIHEEIFYQTKIVSFLQLLLLGGMITLTVLNPFSAPLALLISVTLFTYFVIMPLIKTFVAKQVLTKTLRETLGDENLNALIQKTQRNIKNNITRSAFEMGFLGSQSCALCDVVLRPKTVDDTDERIYKQLCLQMFNSLIATGTCDPGTENGKKNFIEFIEINTVLASQHYRHLYSVGKYLYSRIDDHMKTIHPGLIPWELLTNTNLSPDAFKTLLQQTHGYDDANLLACCGYEYNEPNGTRIHVPATFLSPAEEKNITTLFAASYAIPSGQRTESKGKGQFRAFTGQGHTLSEGGETKESSATPTPTERTPTLPPRPAQTGKKRGIHSIGDLEEESSPFPYARFHQPSTPDDSKTKRPPLSERPGGQILDPPKLPVLQKSWFRRTFGRFD